MTQTNNFPLFFTLERAHNGYILTRKEESSDPDKKTEWIKEVITEANIDERIGHLLQLDTMKNDIPINFFVDAVSKNTFTFEDKEEKITNMLMAKLEFYHYQLKNYSKDVVLALQIKDTNTLEIYGRNAERLASNDETALIRVEGIHMMRFQAIPEVKKRIGSFHPRVVLLDITEEEIMQWYNTHRLDNINSKK